MLRVVSMTLATCLISSGTERLEIKNFQGVFYVLPQQLNRHAYILPDSKLEHAQP